MPILRELLLDDGPQMLPVPPPRWARVGALGVVLLGSVYIFRKMNRIRNSWSGPFEEDTRRIVQKAYGFSALAAGLTATPVLVTKTFGLASSGLFSLIGQASWLDILSWGGVSVLYGFSMTYPVLESSLPWYRDGKWRTFILAALGSGFMLAPMATSTALLALASAYTTGFVAPMSIVAMLAKNRLFLNLVGGIGMAIGLAFVHGEVLPLYLDARQLSPTTLFGGVPLSSLMSTCLLLSIFSAISYLLTANSIFSRAQGFSNSTIKETTEIVKITNIDSETQQKVTLQKESNGTQAPRNFITNYILEGVEPTDYRGMALMLNSQIIGSMALFLISLGKMVTGPLQTAIKYKATSDRVRGTFGF